MDAITNWTTLLVVLSPLFVAFLRRDSMSPTVLAGVTLAVVVATFFLGRFLDGVLTWPLGSETAIELGRAILAQQVVYLLIKNTALVQRLEQAGNGEG